MAQDLIRYDLLAQEALRGLVRKVVSDAARFGLPGEHHFYISFDTRAPGVRMSQRLREKYPEEMTIVLQHQFWELAVTEHSFEVGLSFGNVPERLLVPFSAIKGFYDPSVQFGLQFEVGEGAEGQAEGAAVSPPEPAPTQDRRKSRTGQPRGARSEPAETPPKAKGLSLVKNDAGGKKKPAEPAAEGSDEDKPAGEIVSLDQFRKKP